MSAGQASASGLRAQLAAMLELTKPRLSALAVAATWVGFILGSLRAPHYGRLAMTLLGAALVGGGGHALNQWLERDADALMARTSVRPLPTGRLQPSQACAVGVMLSVVGVAVLGWVNPLTATLGAFTVVSYVGLYTPLKRLTPLCTLVGAIPGAMPPLIGWTGATGRLTLEGWVLFGVLFLWQLPHFLAIAWMYRDQYAAAGFKMLPIIDPDGARTARQLILYTAALVPTSLLPTLIGLAGPRYFYGALAVGVAFAAIAAVAASVRSVPWARRVFVGSISYLPVLMGLMVWDRGPR
jgi:protoheme IX farnesyltransferase